MPIDEVASAGEEVDGAAKGLKNYKKGSNFIVLFLFKLDLLYTYNIYISLEASFSMSVCPKVDWCLQG